MAMAIDNRQQTQLSGMGYDHMRYQAPQFTNPWASAAPSTQLYSTPLTPVTASEQHAQVQSQQPQVSRPTQVTIPPYSGLAVTAPPLGAGIDLSVGTFESQGLQDISQDPLASRPFAAGYVTSAPQSATFAPTSAPQYAMDYSNNTRSPYGFQDPSRRESHPSHPSVAPLSATSSTFSDASSLPPSSMLENPSQLSESTLVDFSRLSTQAQRDSFSEAVDASRGMLSLSQSDITPRNIYGGGNRASTDSYGFPSTHSAHSSISSASTYPSYYNSSVAESVTDYSSASESVGDMNSRTLPRPSALVGTSLPPAPQSMMGQFSSKVSSSSQKKHKCKICDKRFTRPSSLQTHMYSHTGEKPFACEVEGCGRHFSVVSNLRRHRKVHKGERDHPSPEED